MHFWFKILIQKRKVVCSKCKISWSWSNSSVFMHISCVFFLFFLPLSYNPLMYIQALIRHEPSVAKAHWFLFPFRSEMLRTAIQSNHILPGPNHKINLTAFTLDLFYSFCAHMCTSKTLQFRATSPHSYSILYILFIYAKSKQKCF